LYLIFLGETYKQQIIIPIIKRRVAMNCQKCQKEVFLPFRCPYCGNYFCSDHRLPENHDCPLMDLARTPKEDTRTFAVQKQEPYEYTVAYGPLEPKTGKIHFSTKEITHLTIAAFLVIGIGLSIGLLPGYTQIKGTTMLIAFTAILTTSFFIHEIAHKIAAQRRGLWAEFRLTLIGASLTLISIILPLFKIISPGAVMIAGMADRENIGKISVAGPVINIALSIIFLAVAFSIPQNTLALIFLLGAAFNAWIAFFNLIPFGLLDGFKVFLWDKKMWVLTFTASLALMLISYALVFQYI
jgi:Zn-dependent protease